MQFCFVSTRRGSYFMTELLRSIAAATEEAGHRVELVFDAFPPYRDDCVYVVIPHEFRAWGDPLGSPDDRQRASTVALCTENPGTPWFEETCDLAPQFALAISINRSSAAELRRRGIPCEHVQLGYSPLWDSWRCDESVERNIDVLYLGAADPRRDPLVAGLGKDLWARQCQFLIPPLEPRMRPRPDFLQGADKYHRLRSAKTLLNLHRTTSAALEWMRFLESICNGCVVVSEPCLDDDPLVAGEHFVAAPVAQIADAANRLLDDPDRLEQMRARAYDFVCDQLPMEPAARRLAELASQLPRTPSGAPAAQPSIHSQIPAPALSDTTPLPAGLRSHETNPADDEQPAGGIPDAAPSRARSPRGLLGRLLAPHLIRERHRRIRTLEQTPSFAVVEPCVSVLLAIPPEDQCDVGQALASVSQSVYDSFEVLVLADNSNERLAAVVVAFLDEHPSLPAQLLRTTVSSGLGATRNLLVERSRGEYLFTLDAAGGIYPSTLQRLVTALDRNPRAIFAYPMVAVFEANRPVELASSLPWEPERLKRGNWIDGMALIRRARLLELGGYSTDPRLAGWEDFDLWCRCADAEGHGVHVPQVLARRRRAASSAAAGDEDDTPAKWELMRERFPQLFAPSGGG